MRNCKSSACKETGEVSEVSFTDFFHVTAYPLSMENTVEKIQKSESEWREELPSEAFKVLRKEATERAGTSPLNQEKRPGTFVCAGCGLPLFESDTKFDSGTGWPSFYDYIEGNLEFKKDFLLIIPRSEYRCARCGGHQGHVFNDGPAADRQAVLQQRPWRSSSKLRVKIEVTTPVGWLTDLLLFPMKLSFPAFVTHSVGLESFYNLLACQFIGTFVVLIG